MPFNLTPYRGVYARWAIMQRWEDDGGALAAVYQAGGSQAQGRRMKSAHRKQVERARRIVVRQMERERIPRAFEDLMARAAAVELEMRSWISDAEALISAARNDG
jgi:hypothetical protein